jgi:hypothetical protein
MGRGKKRVGVSACRRLGLAFGVRRSAFGVQRSSGQKRVGVRRIGVSAHRRVGLLAPGSWLLAPGGTSPFLKAAVAAGRQIANSQKKEF